LVGTGGNAMRTIWVNRESKNSRQETREAMKERLAQGGSVMVFPEGTTHRGPGVLPLKPGMFYVCADGGFPIYPMAIEYEDNRIAWVDDELFIPHFIQHFGKRRIKVKVRYGDVMYNNDGEAFRQDVNDWMDNATKEMRAEWDG